MAGELEFTATLHRKAYQAMPAPQQAYLLLEAIPTTAAASAQSVNLCLVLDRSGSMAGAKLRHMKEAACLVVDRLGANDILSVVIFDDVQPADLVVQSQMVQDPEKIKRKIQAIQERGGTHMSTGMRLGLQQLQAGQSPERVSSMLLLTDGQTWEDEDQCRQLAEQCRLAGIPITVLGLGVGAGSDWDPRLLEDLARLSGGEWMLVDAPEKVLSAFETTLKSMRGAVATNANLTIRLVQGLTPRSVWRVTPLISRLGGQTTSANDVQVFLGEIRQGVGQAVLVDLLLPPRQAGTYRLLQADITYDLPASKLCAQKVSQQVVVNFTSDESLVAQVDSRLMNIIERVVAHRLQTQALDEANLGEVAKATQRLRAVATRLLELGQDELAQQANLQAQQLEKSGQVDLSAAQKMRYATKRLMQSDLED